MAVTKATWTQKSTGNTIHPETEVDQLKASGTTALNSVVSAFLKSTSSANARTAISAAASSHAHTGTYIEIPDDYYYRPSLMVPHKTYVTIPAGTAFKVNGRFYKVTTATNVNVPSDNHAGKDMYLYACENPTANSTTPVFVISLNSTYPTGYTAATSRKLGGFHGLCVSVGTIADHDLSGYIAGDILPASVWDLKHRALAENEGMVYDEGLGLWVDIYLASVEGTKLVSKNGATVADGSSSTKFSWMKFNTWFPRSKKRMPFQNEFMKLSEGSNQGTNVTGSNDKGVNGGYTDTAGRRMISNIGCESCCGFMWQWGLDAGDWWRWNTSTDNSRNDNAEVGWDYQKSQQISNQWHDALDTSEADAGDVYGKHYRDPARVLLGGPWHSGSSCGSRASCWSDGSLALNGGLGARGVCASRVC